MEQLCFDSKSVDLQFQSRQNTHYLIDLPCLNKNKVQVQVLYPVKYCSESVRKDS